ncbi:MAG TPA: polyprenyl diphosphate synthase [Candidatus Limnocylindria bacterium]|nr:polyprenyl diphosphate synthase [Candidatus Limnocylindria bacterium]
MTQGARPFPRHVAVIMDGNGRWAKQHAVSVAAGHRRGVEALREIIRYSSDAGLEVLSLYAFSTENWTRSPAEVAALMRLVVEFFRSEIDELDAKGVRIRILGEKGALRDGAAQACAMAEERTAGNRGLQLNIALNYGARDELLRAARMAMQDMLASGRAPEELAFPDIEGKLYTAGQPDVDLLIRTSGEQRLSNFLLWQCAYAELLFVDTLWPDFTADDFRAALEAYSRRDRRFGGRSV